MRTIKFRVWIYDKQIEDGYLNDEYYQFHRDNEGYYVYEDWRDAEDGRSRRCIPMQFTGFHDNNGKEIYEGDVLANKNSIPENVVFKDGCFCFYSEQTGVSRLSNDRCKRLEIIGNVFENPNLVKL